MDSVVTALFGESLAFLFALRVEPPTYFSLLPSFVLSSRRSLSPPRRYDSGPLPPLNQGNHLNNNHGPPPLPPANIGTGYETRGYSVGGPGGWGARAGGGNNSNNSNGNGIGNGGGGGRGGYGGGDRGGFNGGGVNRGGYGSEDRGGYGGGYNNNNGTSK